jgi:hypothetical protein
MNRLRASTPLPPMWVQDIGVTRNELVVRENIVWSNGVRSEVRIRARFEGSDYPVTGLPLQSIH